VLASRSIPRKRHALAEALGEPAAPRSRRALGGGDEEGGRGRARLDRAAPGVARSRARAGRGSARARRPESAPPGTEGGSPERDHALLLEARTIAAEEQKPASARRRPRPEVALVLASTSRARASFEGRPGAQVEPARPSFSSGGTFATRRPPCWRKIGDRPVQGAVRPPRARTSKRRPVVERNDRRHRARELRRDRDVASEAEPGEAARLDLDGLEPQARRRAARRAGAPRVLKAIASKAARRPGARSRRRPSLDLERRARAGVRPTSSNDRRLLVAVVGEA